MHMCVYCEHLTTPHDMEYISVQLHIFWWLMCLSTWYRMASMPCTWLHKVGIGKSSNYYTVSLGQGSMMETTTTTPCCTGPPFLVTVGWHVISLKNLGWIHRRGTRCVGRWRMRRCSPHSRPVCANYTVLRNFPFPCTVGSYCTVECCFWWQCFGREDAVGGIWQLHRWRGLCECVHSALYVYM